MKTIRELLERCGIPFYDKQLAWGAKASDYQDDIAACVANGAIPVLVELEQDIKPVENMVIIDHHNIPAKSASSLRQIFNLLKRPKAEWSRQMTLVEANDIGAINGLKDAGASPAEIAAIRTLESQSRGVSPDDLRQAENAATNLEVFKNGMLTVARMRTDKTQPLVDLLENSGNPPRNLLIFSEKETNFFGNGRIVRQLQNKFPGWCGGKLPEYGFWGCRKPLPEVLEFVLSLL